jgi:hypothetical protein
LATADVYTLETSQSGNTSRDEFFFSFLIVIGGDHSALPLIHDVILRTACLVHYKVSPSCKTKFLGTPILRISYGVSWC